MVAGGLLTTSAGGGCSSRRCWSAPLLLVAGRALIRPDEPRPVADHRFDLLGRRDRHGRRWSRRSTGWSRSARRTTVRRGTRRRCCWPRCCSSLLRRASSGAPRRRSCASASCARACWSATNLAGPALHGGVLRLPVPGRRSTSRTCAAGRPLETGLTFAIMGIDLVLAPLLTPALVRRFGNVPVMVAGFVDRHARVRAASCASTTTGATSTCCRCCSSSASRSPSPTARSRWRRPRASRSPSRAWPAGCSTPSFQFGAALGLALVTIVLVGDRSGAPGVGDYRTALLVPAAMALAAALAVVPLRRRKVVPA